MATSQRQAKLALSKLLEYMDDELTDYLELGQPAGHIGKALQTISRYISEA